MDDIDIPLEDSQNGLDVIYKGNSVHYWWAKATVYSKSLSSIWNVLTEEGYPPDGVTTIENVVKNAITNLKRKHTDDMNDTVLIHLELERLTQLCKKQHNLLKDIHLADCKALAEMASMGLPTDDIDNKTKELVVRTKNLLQEYKL